MQTFLFLNQGANTLLKIIILSPFIWSSQINQGYQGCTLHDNTNTSEIEPAADSWTGIEPEGSRFDTAVIQNQILFYNADTLLDQDLMLPAKKLQYSGFLCLSKETSIRLHVALSRYPFNHSLGHKKVDSVNYWITVLSSKWLPHWYFSLILF